MFNHIYGSPFPTINPKVRYRTALERAGFDVNYNPGDPKSGNRGESAGGLGMGQRNVSMGSLQQAPRPRSHNKAAVRAVSLPRVDEQPSERQRYIKSPPPVPKPYAPSMTFSTSSNPTVNRPSEQISFSSQPSRAGSSNPSEASSPFVFEERPIYQERNPAREMNPIERSFMMLTQNDTHSADIPHDKHQVSGLQGEEEVEDPVEQRVKVTQEPEEDINSPSTPRRTVNSTVESLNFEPSLELHVSLSPVARVEPASAGGSKQLPVLSITTHLDPEPKNIPDETEPLDLTPNNDQWSQVKKQHVQRQNGSVSPEELTTPHTATNLQVEKLIAQLDDVSHSKIARLDNPVYAMTANTSLSGSQVDLRSLSVDRTRSPSNASLRFKKSSAYLSQLPEASLHSSNQSVTIDDGTAESPSLKMGDTPTFYKFKQPPTSSFPEQTEIKTPSIEPLQLSHKEKVESSPRTEVPCIPQQATLTPEGEKQQPTQAHNTLKPKPEFKVPPGEGPCRTCGQEVLAGHKRIYSKKENELSGQWHRKCFRCLKCDLVFNKSTPCYILDDKPYCQKHYHEENGSICQVCQGYIEGECLENDRTERFHTHCLTCFLCHSQITSDYFIYNSELPLCGNHDIESLLKDGLDSSVSKRRTRLINFTQS